MFSAENLHIFRINLLPGKGGKVRRQLRRQLLQRRDEVVGVERRLLCGDNGLNRHEPHLRAHVQLRDRGHDVHLPFPALGLALYTKNKMLQETAEKRLSAMREYSDLGSGFKIAMKDLELRGAGNLLGAQQHGHMNAVGYDLYCKMLSEAVKEAKGIQTMDDFETTIDLNIDAFIPDSYISNEFQKLDIYKRIAGIESQQEYDDMLEELIDRFGEPTKAVLNLLAIARLKALAHQGYVTEIKQLGKDVRITLYEKAKLDPAGIPAIMAQYRRGLQFKADHEPKFILTPQGRLIEELMKFAGELAKLAEPLE